MTAPLHPTRLLRAASILTVALIGALALLGAVATVRAAEPCPSVMTGAVAASDERDTLASTIADRGAVDPDDVSDDAGISNEGSSVPSFDVGSAVAAPTVHRPERVVSPLPERPPRA